MKYTLPFYYEATEGNDNGGFPKSFPFEARLDKKLSMFRQIPSKELKEILKSAYWKGSMLTGGMNDAIIGNARVDSAIDFIKKNFNLDKNIKVLEIGCGEGQIIQKLSALGIQCVGLEPAPVEGIENENLKMVRDFFPSKKIKDKFDLILHFGVMEHINDPVNFLIEQQKLLTDGGEIICAIPDCEEDLKNGDISLFLHEHFNYFTKYNIANVAKSANLSLVKTEKSIAGGLFFAKLTKQSTKLIKISNPLLEDKFTAEMERFNEAIIKFVKNSRQEDLAVYCPLRAMNMFYLAGISDCRLVDDNLNMHNKYLPTFRNPIESFEQLKKNPPKKLLIYSKTFDKIIKKKCLGSIELKNTEIKAITDLID